MELKMKQRILLPFICLAASLFTQSCSSELDDNTKPKVVPKEEMLTITITAGTTEDSTATRAVITEKSGKASPWKWEKDDMLQLITTNPSTNKKEVTQLKLLASEAGKEKGIFTGTIPKKNVTSGSYYRFFYTGRTISNDEAKAGKLMIDLSQQTGKLGDLKNYSVLSGTGQILVSGNKAEIEGGIQLKNAFAVAHFAMKTSNGTPIQQVGMRGTGLYCVASVNLNDGNATGVVETDINEANTDGSIMFPQGVTDFYVTLVPATASPTFDAYYSGSFNTVVATQPVLKDYPEEASFVYYRGQKATFSVSDNKKVAITNGNMQYVMPMTTYSSSTMKPKELKANDFVRWAASKPLKVTGNYKLHAGYYRLAPEQWEMAMPRNGKTGGSYTYSTVMYNGKEYISPETYRYFDLPSWGTLNNPTLVDYKYTGPTYPQTYTETQYDYGNKLYVGSKKTRVLTAEEWEYLFSNGAYKNSKRSWGNTPKWAKCFIDENGDNKRNDSQPAELRGFLIFPDNMPIEEAKKVFTRNEDKFGNASNSSLNATTYEKIKKSGAVFLPLTAYRNQGQAQLNEWGQHGNYSTSTYQNKRLITAFKGMYHVRFTINGIVFTDDTVPGQGCASRLVQDLTN